MRLIDADAMRQDWLENGENEYVYDTNAFLDSIEEQPTIDAVPARYGKWKLNRDGSGTCNQCHFTQMAVWDMDGWQNFCGVCGADMRSEREGSEK